MQRSMKWENERYLFEKLKQTQIFRYWKKTQFDCQTGKCAYCEKPMQYRWTETDHIKPLYYGGNSEPLNLVLCHHNCNQRKSTKMYYKRPEWIKQNKYDVGISGKYHALQKELLGRDIGKERNQLLNEIPSYATNTPKKKYISRTTLRDDIITEAIVLIVTLLFLFLLYLFFNTNKSSLPSSSTSLSDSSLSNESTSKNDDSPNPDEEKRRFAQSILASYTNYYNNYVVKYPTSWSLPKDEFNCGNWPQSSGCTLSVYAGAKAPDGYTYSVNSLDNGVIFDQNETIPNALKTNAALYKRARCGENGTVIGGTEDKNAVVVIELSDGTYYCVEN